MTNLNNSTILYTKKHEHVTNGVITLLYPTFISVIYWILALLPLLGIDIQILPIQQSFHSFIVSRFILIFFGEIHTYY